MRNQTLIVALIFLSNFAFSQNAFFDAQYLNTLNKAKLRGMLRLTQLDLSDHEKSVIDDYIKFLDNPFDNTIANLDMSALQSAIEKNNKLLQSNGYNGYLTGVEFSALSLIPSLLGGNFSLSTEQQTKIIDGLTKYYVEEFRKAQMITYMQTFENTIGKVGELQVLLPQTYAKLLSSDPSRFPELGDEYKAVFNDDFKYVIDNLINHIDNHSADSNAALDSNLTWLNSENCEKIKTNQYYDCFKISADIGSKLINNYHPVDLFNYLDNEYYKAGILTKPNLLTSDRVKMILHGLNLIQKNVLDTTKSKSSQFANVWLSLEDLEKLNTDDELLFFTGLIYQQDKSFFNSFVFNASTKTAQTGTNPVDRIELLNMKTKVSSILSALVEIQNFRSNLKEENLKDNFAAYMNLIIRTVESANVFSTATFQLPTTDLKKYLSVADYTMKIYDNARKKNYNNTIYYLVEILNQFLTSNPTYLSVTTKVEQYGNFMTDVINAKNSDEMKNVIKKYAAPPTSFILKREYQRTFSITGQPGYFASMEKFDGKNQNFKFVSGITLPMGFEMTFKSRQGNENSSSWGIFMQVIDLGAVLNFRVGDSTSTLPDKIEFKQIFSPGASINYGFKNSPVTLGLGYQYTSQLRKITESGNEIYPNGHRIFLRLAWDIPLINIAKSKTK
jgi:hypothetical protein